MFPSDRIVEDLPRLAADSFRLAQRLCTSCRTFHSLWPYLRAARMVGAVEAGGTALEAELSARLAASGRVLIAGAADTGQLASVSRAAAGRPARYTVIDRCETPLELCRAFAAQWGLTVDAAHLDLLNLDASGEFDVVIAHSLLQFIPPEHHVDTLARLCRALRPNGHLVHVFNTAARIPDDAASAYRSRFADWAVAELERRGIALPEPVGSFRGRLMAYAQERERREGTFSSLGEVDRLMRAAGLIPEKELEVGTSLSRPYQQFVSSLSKRRHLVVARPG